MTVFTVVFWSWKVCNVAVCDHVAPSFVLFQIRSPPPRTMIDGLVMLISRDPLAEGARRPAASRWWLDPAYVAWRRTAPWLAAPLPGRPPPPASPGAP